MAYGTGYVLFGLYSRLSNDHIITSRMPRASKDARFEVILHLFKDDKHDLAVELCQRYNINKLIWFARPNNNNTQLIFENMVKYNFDLTYTDSKGRNLLHYAAQVDCHFMIRYLVSHHPELLTTDKSGRHPVNYALFNEKGVLRLVEPTCRRWAKLSNGLPLSAVNYCIKYSNNSYQVMNYFYNTYHWPFWIWVFQTQLRPQLNRYVIKAIIEML